MSKLNNEIDRETHKYKKSTIISKHSDKPKTNKNQHYVNNKDLYAALVKRKKDVEEADEKGLDKPQVSNFIGECIMKIAKGLSTKYQFSGYTYRDEMVADAIVHCLRYIDSFDVSKSDNPFSYYTQACYFSFLARIKEEQKETYVRCKKTSEAIMQAQLSNFDGEISEDVQNIHDNLEIDMEFMSRYVDDYEGKMKAARVKVRNKKATKVGLDFLTEDEDE